MTPGRTRTLNEHNSSVVIHIRGRIAGLALLLAGNIAAAQSSFPAHDLKLDGISASKSGDSATYCLLGVPSLICEMWRFVPQLNVPDDAVSAWMSAHPNAVAVPISTEERKLRVTEPAHRFTYVWIEDGNDSLNLELVRSGFVHADALADMVEADRQSMSQFDDPRLASTKAQIEKERAQETAPQRLISDDDYAARMRRAQEAEEAAQHSKKGLWSDEGMKRWKPPSDEQLLADYASHKAVFQTIAHLVVGDGRLAQLSRDPATWERARAAGVAQKQVDQYVGLLNQLGAHEKLASVYGLGKACLIISDITFGMFDNGIIKGYVYAPANPKPIVADLENWPPNLADETTAFRPVADKWYLFEVHH